MTTISEFMAKGHEDCDALFVELESAASRQQWADVRERWSQFDTAMLTHFEVEEEILFPAIEAATGTTQGPTEIMRLDHRQMRGLLQLLAEAITREEAPTFLGLSDTLMITIQQHNMKEEQVLYPMADGVVPAADTIIASMRARISIQT